MKKLKLLLLLAIPVYMGTIISCNKEDDGKVTPTSSASFLVNGVAGNKANLNPGTVIYSAIINSSAKIKIITIDSTVNGATTRIQPSFKVNGFARDTINDTIVVHANTVLTFTVVDINDNSSVIKLNMVVGGAIELTLGAASFNLIDSSYAFVSGGNPALYKYDASGANNADFGYLYTRSLTATIFAPDWPYATSTTTLTQGTSTWSSRKSTKFKLTTLTSAQFDAIPNNDDSQIIAETASGVDSSYVNNLSPSNVIGFIAGNGKKGLIKVLSINEGKWEPSTDHTENYLVSGTIKLQVKVQH